MITPGGKYYLYRHIRLDKNVPFYIGVGTKGKRQSWVTSAIYHRAYEKSGRNQLWHNIVNRSAYEVEIVLESDDIEFIKSKENEFISLYGRINERGEGLLSNMTDGGDYYFHLHGRSVHKNKNREFLSKMRSSPKRIENLPTKSVYVYNIEGALVYTAKSINQCSSFLDSLPSTISVYLKFRKMLKGYFLSLESTINTSLFTITRPLERPVVRIAKGVNGFVETEFKSMKEAALSIGQKSPSNLFTAVKRRIMAGGYYWRYKEDVDLKMDFNKRRRVTKFKYNPCQTR